jgi:protocatechuate 3,4-dioxygenase beta subunit
LRLDEPHTTSSSLRICRFEEMEERQLMTATPATTTAADPVVTPSFTAPPLHVGVVWWDPACGCFGTNTPSDVQISFEGGAAGTQLDQVVIDGSKLDGALQPDDILFDAVGGGGPGTKSPISIVSDTGFTVDNIVENANSTQLIISLTGFTAGDVLELHVNTDRVLSVNAATGATTMNAIVDGADFQGSHFTASFTAPHYQDATLGNSFYNEYDANFAADDEASGTTLSLPSQHWTTTEDETAWTAGAVQIDQQIALPATISGTVYQDNNQDLLQESGEPGVAGVNLELWQWNGAEYVDTGKSTTTDFLGNYSFANLAPGKYQVVETPPTGYLVEGATAGTDEGVPDGQATSGTVISEITVLGGDSSVKNNFALVQPVTLSGYVYHDANDDGQREPGEQGIGGVQLMILPVKTLGGTTTRPFTVTTAADGSYSLSGLVPGTYSIEEITQPAGYLDGLARAGTLGGTAVNPGDEINDITLTSGQDSQENDFGKLLPGNISGFVGLDENNDHLNNTSDPPLSDVQIQLVNSAGKVMATTTTDSQGQYQFNGLAPGSYSVAQIVPGGDQFNDEFAGNLGGNTTTSNLISSIVVSDSSQGTGYNFYDVPPPTISGYVRLDSTDDHQNSVTDPPLSGVTVQLRDSAGNVLDTKQTDANGYYEFDCVSAGSYQVYQMVPAGYYFEDEFAGSAGGNTSVPSLISSIVVAPGNDGKQYNFYDTLPASISGYVHDNIAGDCDNPTNPGVASVTVELLDPQGNVLATAVTNAAGYYQFTGLTAGTYAVEEILPTGYFDEASHVGSAGGASINTEEVGQISLLPGVAGLNYDFCIGQPVSLSGVVYLDANADHANSTSDPVVPGVTIQLLNSQGAVIGTATTNAQGAYSFTGLRPGTYGVNEIQPAGYLLEDSLPGSAGGKDESATLIDSVMLNSGMAGTNYDFWLEQAASLSGTVFQDGPPISVGEGQTVDVPSVRTGSLAPGDKLLAGVTLELRDGVTGAPILGSQALPGYYNANEPITTVTDKNGNYVFNGLLPGNYAVYIQSPIGYITGIDKAGSTGGTVIDAYSTVSSQLRAHLTDPPVTDAIIGINLPVGAQSVDNNFSVDLVQRTKSIFVPPTPATTPPPLQPLAVSPAAPLVAYQPPVTPPAVLSPAIYGSSSLNFTWHLSVVDAGQPRGVSTDDESVAMLISATPEQLAEINDKLDGGEWVLAGGTREARQAAARRLLFGIRGGIPVSGDFDGDGIYEVGVFIDGRWYIDLNGNGIWDKGDLYAKLGRHGDKPVTGDWDGDGKTDIGIFGPAWRGDPRALRREPGLPVSQNPNTDVKKNIPPTPQEAVPEKRTMKVNGERKSRADVIDHVFLYGTPQDVPVVGDWTGEGTSTIAVFRNGTWRFDSNGDGKITSSDELIKFGQRGDKPVVGDWNGDGVSDIGVYRGGTFYLDSNGNHQLDDEDEVVELGGPVDSPAAGDWDGDGRHEPAVFHEAPERVAEKIDFGAIVE